MKASEMNRIFDQCIANYHKADAVDAEEQNPFAKESLEQKLYHKSWIDTVQWHLEDIIRDPEIEPRTALRLKREIDASNQARTDMVEQLDDHFLKEFENAEAKETSRLNTESPAWAIDRMSILALKIYHMQIEASRTDLPTALAQKNQTKLQVLLTQRNDLSLAVDQLMEDLASGDRQMKVYRQMKMYNDPELNPVLYSQKNS